MSLLIKEESLTEWLATDRELVEQVQRGDQTVFRQVYDRYARIVYRYIILRVRNEQEAEDLAAETFIRAWGAIASFEWREASLGAWLLRIAHNLVIDKSRQKRDLLDWLPWRHGEDEPQFARIEDRDEISTAFATLTSEQQVIIYLHFFEGYSLSEISSFLGKSPNAVTVAHFRALQRLRAALRDTRAHEIR
jgi:RNA polymerase sigma-70 factor (ECF subfamily)